MKNQSPTHSPSTMKFAEAIECLLDNKRMRRLEWEDPDIYIIITDEVLRIFNTKDKMLHPMIVSTGDLVGEDWVVYSSIKIVDASSSK